MIAIHPTTAAALVCLLSAFLLLPSLSIAQSEVDFRTATAYPVGREPNSLVIADLNADANLDIAAAAFQDGIVSLLLGDGSGRLQRIDDADTTGRPLGIAAGRFDADELPDLVTTQQESDNMWFLRNLGGGTFAEPQLILGGHDPWGVVAVDFNDDGHLDLLQSLLPEVGGRVNVFYGNGDGTFGEAIGTRTGGRNSAVAVADFNNDGLLDAVASNLTRASVSVMTGRSDGTLAPHLESGVGDNPTGVAAGDLNEDGVADVVASSTSGDAITLSIGIGDGRFEPASFHAVGDAPVGIAVVDLDGDAHLDVAVGNRGDGTVSLLFGDGTGELAPPRTYIADALPLALAVGDLNEDDIPDIATSNAGEASSSVTVLLGNGRGLEAVEQLSTPAPSTALAVGDMDGDALADIVAALPAADSLAIHFRRGQDFAASLIDLGAAPTAVGVVDLDGDDRPDIAAAREGSDDLVIFMNQRGGFGDEETVPVGGVAAGIAGGDYDADGDADLIVMLPLSNEVVLLRGEGDGTLAAPRRIALSARPVALANAQIDAANGIDVAVALASGVVAVFLGDAGGDLEPAGEVTVASDPVALTAVGVNDDAFDDLAVAHASGALRILTGDGQGNFAVTTPAGVLTEMPTSVEARDVTGDGRADLLISERLRDSAAVLASTGNGTFAPMVRIRVGDAPRALRTGDFDGDGGYDFATSCVRSSVAFNRRAGIVRGDANGDGAISAADLIAFAAVARDALCVAVERHPSAGADADGDGFVCRGDRRAAALRLFL